MASELRGEEHELLVDEADSSELTEEGVLVIDSDRDRISIMGSVEEDGIRRGDRSPDFTGASLPGASEARV